MLLTLAWQHLKKRIWEVLAIIVLQIAATIAALELPNLNARIIDEGVATGDTDLIWQLGLQMLVIAAGQMICTAIAIYLGARLAMSLGATLRHRLFTHIHTFSSQDFHAFGGASLITRSTNDVQQVQMTTLLTFSVMIGAPIMGVGGVIQALNQNLRLSWLLAVLVPVLALIIALIMRRLAPLFQLQQERIDDMNTVLREELAGIRVIRAFVRQTFIRQRYSGANDRLRSVALKIGTCFAIMFPAVTIVISLSTVAVQWFGADLIDSGQMQVGELTAFITYVAMISQAVMMAAMIFIMVPRANVSAKRIQAVVKHAPTICDPAPRERAQSPSKTWAFALENVTLRYPGAEEAVLENISVSLAPGTTTAIIGATASGKTTLVNLLPRMMDPSQGAVTASGIPLTALSLADVRSRIAVVPQHTYLFSGSIATTVSGTKNPDAAQRERVQWALEGAQASEFVSSFADGIDHEVEAGGSNFSGGQRQRLAIARALYRQADLYIFDDSFSALDYATDARLRLSLPRYTDGAAVLIVGQRVATIRNADQILVLEDGHIVGRGKHQELLTSCATYKEIVDSQMSEEEAA
ncbi:ABC transporter ATP-binding protein [Schaalia vaccimaxillae]|uniref:ABC transporter ATP-binding protein n=1 Tax=Schaalia vaccimaxillae TaxID=183916 RepID=UPI0003B50AE9|nr:ABC transporter ATP-binding protein [Schaalia vaccimaxillae]